MIPDKFNDQDFFSLEETAEILSISEVIVGKLVSQGKIPSDRNSKGKLQISKNSIELFLQRFSRRKNPGARTSVLVVDDDAAILRVMKRWISNIFPSTDVYTSNNAFEAGQLAEHIFPDLVVLDVKMSGLDGEQACRIFRNSNPSLKILGISGYKGVEESMLNAGADLFLQKPIEREDLEESIRTLLSIS